ncbi:MAG: hypothetical protein UW46_C0006G0032 [Candidatus Yanofskybacteria bacterium GW2011_GWF1_44_227]|nr:MAG: hypothetical protein UT69_C0002G0027 [Candidatus Yanofskybacteria bacterium GW2011_GWE1_40_10]KKT15453.1 MAG: hypothetical protein UV97_C0006G0020 [Candidatus Yanofskybacteria bacterium GW2011_GWF2_43_596]KKT53131.1 MAG: hypothetical protein UW46_C0006G0032 [Candidatus Yanofskybacteria bacterium GW2011_GWF1_44_227]HAU07472.1 hypothetical protein [Candidatus Yanofskybacteria bacterium]HBT80335.1 hypothetical protein [Candidatus Yanofskybacteria bacterium]
MQNIFSTHRRTMSLLGLGLIGLIIVMTNWPLPETLVLAVPFTDQAPTGRWDRNEDCEETSIAMAHAYFEGNRDNELTVALAQEYIAKLRKWEANNIGYNADTGAYTTSRMAEKVFDITVKQIRDYTEKDLKKELSRGHVVLLPINARLLPIYTDSGPFYHMIVVRGYNASGFIVNDPGTTQGNGMIYSFDTLKQAAADWNNSAKTMDATIKIALILSK